eukprot:CAMPEP_0194747018 /NCGR_PEP_ID=MMETSP0323_2-20130528/1083_1 /TAXON_ID=2866 ORGANISM="Crypthecodinium cohnii, Strain Seligo" /NCGR_SAMPLE_ID=MMETSP0323_2 /ASSEMBLY_ACC=CAM_ASM_000346 /LENGTH=95 /DNA_ID=CAMNT_0039659989 /DNA_START=270 /DNA_END=557 /DNA_ORIENTATION=-
MVKHNGSDKVSLFSQVFAHVRLVVYHDGLGPSSLTLLGRLRYNSEADRNVGLVEHHDASVPRGALRDPSEVRLHDVVPIDEVLFTRGLEPDTVLG